jgi:uncharacterized protein YjiS (DUF1127 family)
MSSKSGTFAVQFLTWLWVGPAACANLIRHKCMAFIAWRAQKAAIAELQSLSDRTLKDIGLPRAQIANAVKGLPVDERRP